jgi:uncharacterized protein with FMN-binding domain
MRLRNDNAYQLTTLSRRSIQAMRDNQAAKKFAVSAVIIGIFILYSFMHSHASAALAPTTSRDAGSPASSASSTATSTSAPGATAAPGAKYKDGSYTGSVADAQWGYIQVKAIISGGRITDVQFLQYPNERQRSVDINTYADPQLTSEAIQAQSAQVDIVSGATDSSEAFAQSLADALSQAQA